jgi:hypothetical protein
MLFRIISHCVSIILKGDLVFNTVIHIPSFIQQICFVAETARKFKDEYDIVPVFTGLDSY